MTTEQRVTLNELIQYHRERAQRKESNIIPKMPSGYMSNCPAFDADALFHERSLELLEKWTPKKELVAEYRTALAEGDEDAIKIDREHTKPLGEGDKDALMLTVETLAKAINALTKLKHRQNQRDTARMESIASLDSGGDWVMSERVTITLVQENKDSEVCRSSLSMDLKTLNGLTCGLEVWLETALEDLRSQNHQKALDLKHS